MVHTPEASPSNQIVPAVLPCDRPLWDEPILPCLPINRPWEHSNALYSGSTEETSAYSFLR